MKEKLVILLLPILFSATIVDSTEVPFEITQEEYVTFNQKEYQPIFHSLPSNPISLTELHVFKDMDLTHYSHKIGPDSSLELAGLEVNNHHQQVFTLSDGTYVLASQDQVADDRILNQVGLEQTYWTKENTRISTSPVFTKQDEKESTLPPYQPVQVDTLVETPRGQFVQIVGKGWAPLDHLSTQDNRMEGVQKLLDTKYNKDNYSIYVKQVSSQLEAGINQDKILYAASVSKLPTLYYAQKQIDLGRFKLTDKVKYVKETEDFDGAYDPAGSGSISKRVDNKEYQVDDLLNRIAKESDNVASNIVGYYLADKFNQQFYDDITSITGQKWDMVTRETSPKVAGLMMEAIYHQGGFVLDSLKETRFDDQRIPKYIPVPVAHKIGDAYDFRHDVALVYTDSPFILSIFTDKASYDDISQIAKDIYEILK